MVQEQMDLGDQIHKELKLQPFKEKQIDARLASESQHGMINSFQCAHS